MAGLSEGLTARLTRLLRGLYVRVNAPQAAGLAGDRADRIGSGWCGPSKRKYVSVRNVVRDAEVSAQPRGSRALRPDQARLKLCVGSGRVNRPHWCESRRRRCEIDVHDALPLQQRVVGGRVADLCRSRASRRSAAVSAADHQRAESADPRPVARIGTLFAFRPAGVKLGRVRICQSVEPQDRPAGLRPQQLQERLPAPLGSPTRKAPSRFELLYEALQASA